MMHELKKMSSELNSLLRREISMEILLGEIGAIVIEIYEFEYRDKFL